MPKVVIGISVSFPNIEKWNFSIHRSVSKLEFSLNWIVFFFAFAKLIELPIILVWKTSRPFIFWWINYKCIIGNLFSSEIILISSRASTAPTCYGLQHALKICPERNLSGYGDVHQKGRKKGSCLLLQDNKLSNQHVLSRHYLSHCNTWRDGNNNLLLTPIYTFFFGVIIEASMSLVEIE